MFTDNELEVMVIALEGYLEYLNKDATYREIVEVENLLGKVDDILNFGEGI